MDRQPVLKGDLLELRPLVPADFNALFAAAADPEIWRQHPQTDRYKPDVLTEFFDDAISSGGAMVAIDRLTGIVAGSSRFHGFDADRREVEIGWTFLSRVYWGGQYNGEMKKLMLSHAFQFVDTVLLLVGPDNLRSQVQWRKVGGVRAGRRTDGSGRDSFVYVITEGMCTPC